MNDDQIIALLDRYGHLKMPFGGSRQVDPKTLNLKSQAVADALESFQNFNAVTLEPILAAFYPKMTSPTIKKDGLLGPATMKLLTTARCACPDYAEAGADFALGNGNWKGCNGIGNFHCAVVKFLNEPPSFLAELWNSVWDRVVESYAELGLLFKRDDNAARPNIELSFVSPDGGWIGLAIVGQGETCQSAPIWCRFDKNYKPNGLLEQWTTLVKHELGHNCGLQHSQGGVMNPYIVANLPVSWANDPSYNLLVSRFGGQPIPSKPKNREMVVAWMYENGTFEKIFSVPSSGGSMWPM